MQDHVRHPAARNPCPQDMTELMDRLHPEPGGYKGRNDQEALVKTGH
jgi:hypothetical protein